MSLKKKPTLTKIQLAEIDESESESESESEMDDSENDDGTVKTVVGETSGIKSTKETESSSTSSGDDGEVNDDDGEAGGIVDGNDSGGDDQDSGDNPTDERSDEGEEKVKKFAAVEKKSNIDRQYDEIRKEISNLPFEDLQKLQNKMGLKLFNQIYHGKEVKKALAIPKRANKNRPQELSSKKPPKQRRYPKKKPEEFIRDPRFDERSGEFDEQQFKESYAFIDDIKEREKSKLKQMLSKEKNPEKKHKVAYLLNRMTQQEDTQKRKDKTLEVKRKIKKTEREDVVVGQTPFYLKKSDQKKLELAEKFRELKKSGKLDKFMSKKRKKLAQKDRKKMPNV